MAGVPDSPALPIGPRRGRQFAPARAADPGPAKRPPRRRGAIDQHDWTPARRLNYAPPPPELVRDPPAAVQTVHNDGRRRNRREPFREPGTIHPGPPDQAAARDKPPAVNDAPAVIHRRRERDHIARRAHSSPPSLTFCTAYAPSAISLTVATVQRGRQFARQFSTLATASAAERDENRRARLTSRTCAAPRGNAPGRLTNRGGRTDTGERQHSAPGNTTTNAPPLTVRPLPRSSER